MTKHRIKPRQSTIKTQGKLLAHFINSVVFPVLIVFLVARIFIVQPFYIPSGSMHPTLIEGDQLIVSKFSYGLSRFSIPFSPELFEGRVFESLPERGDVAVFRQNDNEDWIKRVIGLPGDTIEVVDGRVYLNGEKLAIEAQGSYTYTDAQHREVERTGEAFIETLPSGVRYRVLDSGRSVGDKFETYRVPEGHVFVMGDNRDNSRDSRFVGPIPTERLVGKAKFIHFSYDWHTSALEIWKWPEAINFGRIFSGFHVD